jgi:hypothetical protein
MVPTAIAHQVLPRRHPPTSIPTRLSRRRSSCALQSTRVTLGTRWMPGTQRRLPSGQMTKLGEPRIVQPRFGWPLPTRFARGPIKIGRGPPASGTLDGSSAFLWPWEFRLLLPCSGYRRKKQYIHLVFYRKVYRLWEFDSRCALLNGPSGPFPKTSSVEFDVA